jgi:hypothetical protein
MDRSAAELVHANANLASYAVPTARPATRHRRRRRVRLLAYRQCSPFLILGVKYRRPAGCYSPPETTLFYDGTVPPYTRLRYRETGCNWLHDLGRNELKLTG